MEVSLVMSKRTVRKQVGPSGQDFSDLVGELIRLQPRLKALLPTDLARLKKRLHRGGRRSAEYELFYRVGLILTRRKDPQTMGEIRTALAVPLSTATRMINWLVANGYARRLADPEDRRIVRVALTRSGTALYAQINTFIRRKLEAVRRRFSPDEYQQLVVLLHRLVAVLDEVSG